MKSTCKNIKLKSSKEDTLYNISKESLHTQFSLSLTFEDFKKLINQRRIRVKGIEVNNTDMILKKNDSFTISLTKSDLRNWSLPVEETIKVTPGMILHEENIFLVGNKPSNISSNATIQSTQDNFLAAMTRYISGPHKEKYIALHHRIDFETSGVLLFCKKKSFNKYFTDLFEKKIIKKTYLALVIDKGNSFKDITVINQLDRDPRNRMRMKSVKVGGKVAKTTFKKISHCDGRTLVEASPETGRLHQIRVHLSEKGFPILGDSIYGEESKERTLLHAYKISFPHPETEETVEYCAPLPEDFPKEMM